MKQLPVWQHRQEILDALATNQVIVVESPTGSGKTTQIPLILKDAGYCDQGSIGITQPRRIATLSICDFIKKQIGDVDGDYVGYKMRFTDTTTPMTRIKIMTDGILLMELKSDPLLQEYGVIVVDEAHERSLNIDFILGLLKHIIAERPDFKVIISSATINTKTFSAFFDGAPIISIQSRVFPVSIIYRPLHSPNDPDELTDSIVHIVHERMGKGDILVFLPGEFDIVRTVQQLYLSDPEQKLVIYPLYARLSKEDQESVFTPTPAGKTKVVVATNIAETSVTIDGITTVIDSGIAKINFYNQKDFTSSLVPLPVSKSSAEQRKGRAGRTQSGVCYRLYAEKDFSTRFTYGTEEILRTDLSEVMLRMSDLGIYDYGNFPYITKPKRSAILSAEDTLRFIGAIDGERHLTTTGTLMCKFPLLPRHSRVLVESLEHYPDVLEQVLVAVAFLSCKTPFLFPSGEEDAARAAQHAFSDETYGDFVTYLHVFEQYVKNEKLEKKQEFCKRFYLDFQSMQEIVHVKEQLEQICGDLGYPISHLGTPKEYLVCIASGLVQYVCIRSERNIYQSLTAGMIFIHPGSAYFRTLPRYIIAGEIVQTSRMYARSVSPLQREWLDDIRPNLADQLDSLVKGKGKTPKESYDRNDRRVHLPVEGDFRANDIVQVYKRKYPTITLAGKKGDLLAVIPYEDLSYLANFNNKTSKRPRNFRATLTYKGYNVHPGEKFFSLLDLNGKLMTASPIYDAPPSGTYSFGEKNIEALVSKFSTLLCFCKSKKERKTLYFIQLDGSGDTFRFTTNRNFFDALDTTLFFLGQLKDMVGKDDKNVEPAIRKTMARLLKLAE